MKKDKSDIYIIDAIDMELANSALNPHYIPNEELISEKYIELISRAKRHEILESFLLNLRKKTKLYDKEISLQMGLCSMLSRKQLKELYLINEQFEKNGIEYVLFKGFTSVYWKSCYVEEKACTDFDILVNPGQVDEIYKIVKDMGYEMLGDREGNQCMKALAWHGSAWNKKNFSIEIHHRYHNYGDNYQVNALPILERSMKGKVNDISFHVPSLEDHLLLLCIHMYHHEYRGMKFKLKYHKEIDNTIVNNNIDWDIFLEHVRECSANFAVMYSLYYCNEIYEQICGKRLLDKDILNKLEPKEFNIKKNQLSHRHFLDDHSFGDWDLYLIFWEKRFGEEWKGGYAQRLFSDEQYVAFRFYCLCFYYSVQNRWKDVCNEFGIEYEEKLFF